MKKIRSLLAGREVEISDGEFARRMAQKKVSAEPLPSYELIIAERDSEGGIRRIIMRPLVDEATAAPAKSKAA